MEWLNLRTSVLHAAEYIRSKPLKRATWLNVSLWCVSQENGGRIVSARAWKDREWQQVCGVTAREVNASAPLLAWDGDDLVVWNYPLDREREIRAKREAGKVYADKRWAKPNAKHDGTPIASPNEAPTPELHAEGNRNRKGKEGNDLASVAPRPRDVLFDALSISCGEGNPSDVSKDVNTATGVALSKIKKLSPDVTVEEIERRAANYRGHFEGATLTAGALAKHWARCADAPLNLGRVSGGRKSSFA